MEDVRGAASAGPLATTRLLLWLVAVDLVITSIVLLFWLLVFEVADPRVMLPATAIRMLAIFAVFVRMLGPTRAALIRDADAEDELLLGADRSLQQLDARMMSRYAGAWLAAAGVSLLLAIVGIPTEASLGRAELATAIVMMLSLAAVSLPLRALVRAQLFASQRRICARIMTRGLAVTRSPHSVGGAMRAIILGIVASTIPAMLMTGVHLHVSGLRATAMSEALRRAEQAAVAVSGVAASLEPGAKLVDSAGLPARLQARREAGAVELRAYDRVSREALAAVPLAGDRWVVVQTEVDEQLGIALAIVAFVSGFGLALAWVAATALWRPQQQLFEELDEATRRTVEVGDIGALARLIPMQDDQLGRLAVNFNRMLDMFDELTAAATAVARGSLDVQLDRPGELHDAFRGMLEQLRRVVPRIRATAVELAGAASEIQAAMGVQGRAGEQQSRSVVMLGASVGALSSTASEIARDTARVLANAEQVSEATRASTDELAQLRTHTSGVSGLLTGIHEIADRSDLLALNGSLEATRAGDAGRGFALVATEMRRLAERVGGLVDDVHGRIADIERASQATIRTTERSHELARSTAGTARRIAGLIEEHDRATTQVVATVDGVARSITAVAQAGGQTRDTARGLEDQATRLEQLTRRFDAGRA